MRRILCYGDSNTWGQSAVKVRYADDKQWPVLLQKLLGDDYRVIQEGLSGRTAGNCEVEKLHYNGQDSFRVVLDSASPLDLVIIALGSNDFKPRYNRTAQDIANDLLWYREAANAMDHMNEGRALQFLYLCPANFIPGPEFSPEPGLREELIALMRKFDTSIIELNDLELSTDGIHYSENAHAAVAKRVADKIKEINV